ncbi:Aste57867_24329 [Aphanomyces stellatus]|uniref:Aste57867_24329 protein n=1 Tax=Aphanomyces stellatus TaxID=120398 RepID=A0A485LUH9_9STRA|nr:hypothetical protein As57867_024254 [Aphanomyces stellatus]VFU00969.1 Aste57867_24329 [Aphanomyces stellatus]
MGCAHSTPGNPDQFNNWTATDATNSSPCPFVNSFANHGVIPRTGITIDSLKAALSTFQADETLIKFLTGSTTQGLFKDVDGTQQATLADLGTHNVIEHDASLSRQDAAAGDAIHLDPELLAALIAHSSDGQYLTKEHLAHYRAIREEHSKANNPDFKFDLKQQFVAYGEAALLLLALKDTTGNIRIDWLKMVFEQEKLPLELGWTVRPITFDEVLLTAGELRGEAFEKTIVDLFY